MRTVGVVGVVGVVAVVAALSTHSARADVRHDHNLRDSDPLGALVPDFIRLQVGGYTGLISIGVGYAALDDVVNYTIEYGFTPASVAGRSVHTVGTHLTLRPVDVRFGDTRWVPAYGGAGLLFTFGDGYFVNVPERYRDRTYYPPTGVHWFAITGSEVSRLPADTSFFERHGLYWEARVLDTFLFSLIENPRTIAPIEAAASALGYRAAF
jgi:hypothetical protein